MWEKLTKRTKSRRRDSELYYATHYHLIPLYIICGILIVTTIILGCYLRYVYTLEQTADVRRMVTTTNMKIEQEYLPVQSNITDGRAYIPTAAVRFTPANPYQILRYSYQAGTPASKNGVTLSITTEAWLQMIAANIQSQNPRTVNVSQLEQCSRPYVVRFVPGSTQYGGFTPFKEIKLKDGRTAYIYKNTTCLRDQSDSNTTIQELETTLQTIESY